MKKEANIGCDGCLFVNKKLMLDAPGIVYSCLQGHLITSDEIKKGCDDFVSPSDRKMTTLEKAMRIAWWNL